MSILKNYKYSKSFTTILIIMLMGITSQTLSTDQKTNIVWATLQNWTKTLITSVEKSKTGNSIKTKLMEKNTQYILAKAKKLSQEITLSGLTIGIITTGLAYQVHSVMTCIKDLNTISAQDTDPACTCSEDYIHNKPSQFKSIAKLLCKSSLAWASILGAYKFLDTSTLLTKK